MLMSYCLDKDIPALGLCCGMQMLDVVSGVTSIQDIPTFLVRRKWIFPISTEIIKSHRIHIGIMPHMM